MTDLCKLAAKYGTDKFHWYTPVYDLLLRHHRNGVRRVLEIGIGTKKAMQHVPNYQPGASLRMWQDYFPAACVYGADVVPFDMPGCICLDQSNEDHLRRAGREYGPFDLIVDDGSHKPEHQILGAKTLVPYLKKDGLYIIEDVNNFEEITRGIEMDALCISFPHTGNPAARCMVISA